MQKLQKQVVERNFPKFTRKYLFLIFFDNVRCCRSATSLKTTLQCRSFLLNFVKFVITPFFLQNNTRRLLLIITASIRSSTIIHCSNFKLSRRNQLSSCQPEINMEREILNAINDVKNISKNKLLLQEFIQL